MLLDLTKSVRKQLTRAHSNIMVFSFPVFIISTVGLLLTPGPTNTLLATAGLRHGTAALPLIGSELAGYIISILIWELFLAPVQLHFPWAMSLVKAVCSCYLAYVAFKLWRTAPLSLTSQKRAISHKALFVATLLNPKGILFASTIFPNNIFDNTLLYILALGLFSCLLPPIGFLWVRFGAALNNDRLSSASPITLQKMSALMMGAFSMYIACLAWAQFH